LLPTKSNKDEGGGGQEGQRKRPARRSDRPGRELDTHQVDREVQTLELQNRRLRDAQLETEQARRRYADLYDFAPVAYLTLDAAGRITAANLTTTRLLGIPRTHLLGASLARLVHVSDLERFTEHLRFCFERRAEIVTELKLLSGRPESLSVQASSTPIFDESDNVVECRTTLTNVSALKRSEERLSLLSDASRVLSAALDHEVGLATVSRLIVERFADLALIDVVDEDGRLRRVAHAAVRNVPLSPRAAVGPSQLKVLSSGRPLFLANCSPADLSELLGPELHLFVRRTGASALMMLPLVSRGLALGVLTLGAVRQRRIFSSEDLATAEDLAARVAGTLDNARLHQQAREAVEAREEMLAFATHDLKNPLYALMLCLMGAVDRPPEVERRRGWPRIDRVKRIARQMNRIVGDLSEFCGLAAEPFALAPAAREVPQLLDEVLDSMVPLAEEKKIDLRLETPLPAATIWCDTDRVFQIFSSLIGNAVTRTPGGGTIEVSVKAREDGVLFTVGDNGAAIRPADLPHVFDRYARTEEGGPSDTPRELQRGRGFGLYLARRLVDAHGGTIRCESEAGGTVFFFTLPRPAAP
jgi:PAS domain S-box-containing protein